MPPTTTPDDNEADGFLMAVLIETSKPGSPALGREDMALLADRLRADIGDAPPKYRQELVANRLKTEAYQRYFPGPAAPAAPAGPTPEVLAASLAAGGTIPANTPGAFNIIANALKAKYQTAARS
jgi:hypothetical protein